MIYHTRWHTPHILNSPGANVCIKLALNLTTNGHLIAHQAQSIININFANTDMKRFEIRWTNNMNELKRFMNRITLVGLQNWCSHWNEITFDLSVNSVVAIRKVGYYVVEWQTQQTHNSWENSVLRPMNNPQWHGNTYTVMQSSITYVIVPRQPIMARDLNANWNGGFG